MSAHKIARADTSPQLAAQASFDCTYVVRPGDDLFRIALRFGTTSFTLALMNGIANRNSLSGQLSFDTTRVTNGSTGRVELAEISAGDGSMIASVSVPVRFSC